MRSIKTLLPLAGLVLALGACRPSGPAETRTNTAPADTTALNVRYASRFSMSREHGYKLLKIYGNRNDHQATASFVLYPKSGPKPKGPEDAYYIGTPVARVASMSSIYGTMLTILGVQDRIVAIENVDYYNNPYITANVKNGRIKELSKGPEINVEQTLLLKPDLVLTYGMGNPKADVNPKISGAGIPVAISLDHLEESPLGRAEWIKFYAAFFDKDALADSLFSRTEQNYNRLSALTDTVHTRPKVLTELKYGDAWYVPAGNSYISHMLHDAGADFIWKDEKRAGSIPLPFETVFTRAKDCDYWLHLFLVNSKMEMLNYDERYALFKAFKTGNLYNNNKVQNANGYSDYWETGICNPDLLLEDLIFIFHPNLLPGHQLRYYKRIE